MRVATKHDLFRATMLVIVATLILLPVAIITGCTASPGGIGYDKTAANIADGRLRDAVVACKSQGRVMVNYKAVGSTEYSFDCVDADGLNDALRVSK